MRVKEDLFEKHIITKNYTKIIVLLSIMGVYFSLAVWIGIVEVSLVFISAIWGAYLFYWGIRFVNRNEYYQLVVELWVPAILWLIFGIGGIIALIKPEGTKIYGEYDSLSVILVCLLALLGSVIYLIGLKIFQRKKNITYRIRRKHPLIINKGLFTLLVVILLLIDWYGRITQIIQGTYFTWISKIHFATVRGTTIIFHIQESIEFVLIGLILFLVYISRKRIIKRVFLLLLIIQSTLIFLRGDRSGILYTVIVIALTWMTLWKPKFKFKLILQWTLIILILLGILGPFIQEARFIMRQDVEYLLSNPSQIPVKFIAEYLPAVMNLDVILGSGETYRSVGYIDRLGSYSSYAASGMYRIINGYGFRSFSDFNDSILLLVPRFIYPEKPTIDADYLYQQYFLIGVPGNDAHGTPLIDIFSFLSVIGVILLFFIVGICLSFLRLILLNYFGVIGELILIGSISTITPIGDSFTTILASIRNLMFIVILLVLIHQTILPSNKFLRGINHEY